VLAGFNACFVLVVAYVVYVAAGLTYQALLAGQWDRRNELLGLRSKAYGALVYRLGSGRLFNFEHAAKNTAIQLAAHAKRATRPVIGFVCRFRGGMQPYGSDVTTATINRRHTCIRRSRRDAHGHGYRQQLRHGCDDNIGIERDRHHRQQRCYPERDHGDRNADDRAGCAAGSAHLDDDEFGRHEQLDQFHGDRRRTSADQHRAE
jgi:hypothetical protein